MELSHPGLPTRVLAGEGLLDDAKRLARLVGRRAAVVVAPPSIEETHLARLRATLERARVRHATLVCDDGERGKSLDAFADLCRAFEAVGADRDTLVIGMGGGTLLDLAGFAASAFLRGLPYATVPTTVVAQADACVGGKCGVHLDGLKNRVGAFHHPEWALLDPETLLTLPEEHHRPGFAELAKCALLDSPESVDLLLASLPAFRARETGTLAVLVAHAVAVKLERAGEDPFDRAGRRAELNLGHTLGHALETVSDFELSHGEAVALGLLFSLSLGARSRRTDPPVLLPLARAFGSLGLLSGVPFLEATDELLEAMLRDKKCGDGAPRLVTLAVPGKPRRESFSRDELSRALEGFRDRFAVARTA